MKKYLLVMLLVAAWSVVFGVPFFNSSFESFSGYVAPIFLIFAPALTIAWFLTGIIEGKGSSLRFLVAILLSAPIGGALAWFYMVNNRYLPERIIWEYILAYQRTEWGYIAFFYSITLVVVWCIWRSMRKTNNMEKEIPSE